MEEKILSVTDDSSSDLKKALVEYMETGKFGISEDKANTDSDKNTGIDTRKATTAKADGKKIYDCEDQEYKDKESILKTLYGDRSNFSIVGLTGYVGSGCSRLAGIMSLPFKDWPDVRQPKDLKVPDVSTVDNESLMYAGETNHKAIASAIFARKYSICHDFANQYYEKYEVVKYSSVLVFVSLWRIVRQMKEEMKDTSGIQEGDSLKEEWIKVMKDKYRPSKEHQDDDYRSLLCKADAGISDFDISSEGNNLYIWEDTQVLKDFPFSDWTGLYKMFEGSDKDAVRRAFFDASGVFCRFIDSFGRYIWKNDPYCTAFFFHRLGYVLRASGNPLTKSVDVSKSDCSGGQYFFMVVSEINQLIKVKRKLAEEAGKRGCRIVIDKIRNSLEAKYLKERYSAFYLLAVHEDKDVAEHLRNRIEEKYSTYKDIAVDNSLIGIQIRKIQHLDREERDGKEFEEGCFYSPNTSQCVADAEIHLSNDSGSGKDRSYFYSLSEQWMKYASLILHPGLITPSSEERCMVVAYTAKFNSGCLSRQVGAVITNKAHTIRSIGWNDVPYGQIPCSLRELQVMAYPKYDALSIRGRIYSEYERGAASRYPKEETFDEFVKDKFKNLHLIGEYNEWRQKDLMKGLPNSYCFKTLQNKYENVKNQVHTRSLHAEENAILQMAKYGGEGLHEGIIYVTASPCELCCKKLYQIGVRKIVYIDEYPGISRENIIHNGYHQPWLKQFQGAYGATYFKLYQPFISYKDELTLRRVE